MGMPETFSGAYSNPWVWISRLTGAVKWVRILKNFAVVNRKGYAGY